MALRAPRGKMRGSRIRRMFGRKSKRGASLATVLVSMAILAIVATMFTAIAMRSYQYSYAKLCKQQAYYTATSTIESYYQTIRQSSEHLSSMINALEAAYQDAVKEENGLHVDPTRVSVKVGSSGGADSSGMLVDGGFFDTYLGECELYVRYANSDRSEISIEAHATYNGYTETARAKVARTNLAASEPTKIFDNVFCLQSPITTIVADAAYGDVYVSQPMVSYFLDESGNKVTAGNEGAYNTVLASLEKDGSFGGYSAQPGQYLRNRDGTILTGDSIAGKYNAVLRDYVYANVQASTEEGGLTGHTKPLDMDNTPLYSSSALDEKDRWYNDWVELYMFSASTGGTTLDGNLYADSRVLVGLLDRNEAMREYVRYWDDTVKRSVYSKDKDSDTLTNYLQDNTFVGLSLEAGFEHGFGKDVFFDHESTTLDRALSKFRINGNCYFWEDARIENFDSTQTENALSGIKNNIYAHKDLYIDGLYIYKWISATPETSSEVSIYGDVVVQGDAFIANADIYGDVYCYGDKLTIVSSNIYGNVYFEGSDFTADTMVIQGGVLEISVNGKTGRVNCPGGNLVIEGAHGSLNARQFNEDAGFGTAADVGGSGTQNCWGATLTNCSVYGSIWSGVNTHIMCSKWEEGSTSLPDYYGNIFVKTYLFIDLTRPYLVPYEYAIGGSDKPQTEGAAEGSGHRENWTGNLHADSELYYEAACWNCFERTSTSQVIYADRFQMVLNQSTGGTQSSDVQKLGTLLVGSGGFYIDGNDRGHDEQGIGEDLFSDRNKSTKFVAIYSQSEINGVTNAWDYQTDQTGTYGWRVYSESDIAGRLSAGAGAISGALETKRVEILSRFSRTATSYGNEVFGNKLWDEKLISIKQWSAPPHTDEADSDDAVTGKAVVYAGGDAGFGSPNSAADAVDAYLEYLKEHSEAGGVSGSEAGGNYTLAVTQSVTFAGRADFSRFDRVVIDTSSGNVHMRFLGGAEFGDPAAVSHETGSDVVLTGGNLTFWYLYEEDYYDFNSPSLKINPFTELGLVQVSAGGYGNDGLYIISNDDALLYMSRDVSLNGFIYMPHGQVYIQTGTTGGNNVLNGCMAIESLVVNTKADESTISGWDKFVDWILGGNWNTDEVVDLTVKQYENVVFNYVMSPLIVDVGFQYGDTMQEITNFGQVVWEFMGYY